MLIILCHNKYIHPHYKISPNHQSIHSFQMVFELVKLKREKKANLSVAFL